MEVNFKKNGKYKLVETIGCNKDKFKTEELVKKAELRIKELEPNLFDYLEYKEKKFILKADNVKLIKDELVFEKIFNDIGCRDILFPKEKQKKRFNHSF